MEQGMEMLFALFGGLAMFLYGMDRMSRALQRAAGDAMKRLLARQGLGLWEREGTK